MYKYEMEPTSIVEVTERTRFCPQTDRQTDGRTMWNQYTLLSTSLKRGYNEVTLKAIGKGKQDQTTTKHNKSWNMCIILGRYSLKTKCCYDANFVDITINSGATNDDKVGIMTTLFSMLDINGLMKKDVTPLLTHWSYVFLALTHGYVQWILVVWSTTQSPALFVQYLNISQHNAFCLTSQQFVTSDTQIQNGHIGYNRNCPIEMQGKVKTQHCDLFVISNMTLLNSMGFLKSHNSNTGVNK